ncbi:hypothetical protein ACWGJD_30835, partial [Streptomyces sp. NPDC054826]
GSSSGQTPAGSEAWGAARAGGAAAAGGGPPGPPRRPPPAPPPRPPQLLEELGAHRPVDRAATVQLGMYTGLFNVLWATVTVLMIVRPGSTTGA